MIVLNNLIKITMEIVFKKIKKIFSNAFSRPKIKIISSKYAPIPFSPPLEQFVLPQVKDIAKCIRRMLE